jgi:hypothetical protein
MSERCETPTELCLLPALFDFGSRCDSAESLRVDAGCVQPPRSSISKPA